MNYLLAGPEEYLKERFLEKLKKSVLDKNQDQKPDFEVFRASESKISDIFDASNTLPFASKHKIIAIKDIDKFSPKEKDSILKCLKTVPAWATIVLSSSSGGSGKFAEALSKHAKLIMCERLKANDLNLWIKREFASRKKNISIPLANVIREQVGGDLFLLENEIEKIASFAGADNVITESHVEKLLGGDPYKTAFELVDLVLKKNMKDIFISIDNLLKKEKPHRILSLLAWQFRNFIKVKNIPRGSSLGQASRALGANEYFARKIIEKSRPFTRETLEKNLEIILEGDLFIKRGLMAAEEALERVLANLCR